MASFTRKSDWLYSIVSKKAKIDLFTRLAAIHIFFGRTLGFHLQTQKLQPLSTE